MRDSAILLAKARLRFADFDAVVAWVLGVAFIASGVPHLGNPYFFLASIYSYEMVGPKLGELVAMWLPFLQVVLAICLVSGLLREGALLVSLPVLLGFATIQTIAAIRGLNVSCGCFGSRHETTIGWSSLSVIYALALLSLIRFAVARWWQSEHKLRSSPTQMS